jgi:GTP1/Obg family GTP-binding protein
MKPVNINFTDDEGKVVKTYTTCSLKTGMMDNIFEIAEKADNLKNEKDINNVREFYSDLKSIILSVFKYKFSLEELNENVETDELMKVFKDICSRISGEMKKN